MRPLSRDEVRRIDAFAIETLGIPGLVLMENAGRNCADVAERMLGSGLGGTAAGKKIAVVAGAGNNGGDGFVIARHLGMRGAKVVTFLVVPRVKLTGDAKTNLDALLALSHEVRNVPAEEIASLAETLGEFDLVVDAIGGTGIRGPLRGEVAAAVEQVNLAARPVLAVDIPTGLDCDTGSASGPTIRATLTVTFVARKKGFDTPTAASYTGEVVVADIGIPAEAAGRTNATDKRELL